LKSKIPGNHCGDLNTAGFPGILGNFRSGVPGVPALYGGHRG